jgi:hypothetical protein
MIGDGGVFYTIDMFGTSFSGEDAENSGSAANIEDYFVLEEGS